MYKRIEISNFKEIQQELVDYDFYSRESEVDSEDSPLVESKTSASSFLNIPNLPKLHVFLESILHTECITHFHVLNMPAHSNSNVHVDLDNSVWALNIPIKNTENSYTVFYANDEKTEIDRITLDVPHFLRVGDTFHQLINYGDESRLAMTIRFTGRSLAEVLKV